MTKAKSIARVYTHIRDLLENKQAKRLALLVEYRKQTIKT